MLSASSLEKSIWNLSRDRKRWKTSVRDATHSQMHRYHLPRSGGCSRQEECERYKEQEASDVPKASGLCSILENTIRIFSVLYDGNLTITEPDNFRDALKTGIGHGKGMGLGLLSVVPIA